MENSWPGAYQPERQPFGAVTSITTKRPLGEDEVWSPTDWYMAPGNVIRSASSALTTLVEGQDWIEIVYTAGYADAASFEAAAPDLKHALMIVAHEYAVWNRDVGNYPQSMGWPASAYALVKPHMPFRGV